MKKITIILLLIIISCNTSEKNDILKEKVEKGLSSNQNVDSLFLNLNFGMSLMDFENHLKGTTINGKTKNAYVGYSYEFKDNEKLKGIDWIISPQLHNDTLIGIKLHSFKKLWKNNDNTINEIYSELTKEYKSKFGEPDFIGNRFENYWIKDNLMLTITKSDNSDLGGTVNINYIDKRREKNIDLTKCAFDQNGNSMDLWYYELKKDKGQIINKDI